VKNILLVAAREYKQIASTRGFWVMLLVLPVVIGISQVAGRFFRPQTDSAYVLVDQSGQYEAAIDRRLNLNYQRSELSAFSAYVQRWELADIEPDAVWAKGDRWFTDSQIEQFVAAGGIDAAWKKVSTSIPEEAPDYEIDRPAYTRAQPPAGVTVSQGPETFAEGLADPLKGDEIETPEGKRPLALAIWIPSEISPASPVRMWTNGTPNTNLVDNVRNEITRIQRARALESSGLTPEAATSIIDISTPISLSAPPQGAGREQVAIRSALPLAMVYLLLVTVMTTGSMMLQDAQAYLMPVIMIIMLPVVFMMVSVLQQPNGMFPVVMSWIPLYTPFAMLARLGAGVSVIEVIGTGAMLAAFVAIEMILLGRIFQASLLRTGQPPKLGAFIGMMFGKNTG
jgi:ABC-2 type transport system permease protein